MTSLRDLVAQHSALVLTLGGLAIGFVFGALTSRTNFCTMGALSDAVNLGDLRRLRAWALAAAVAIICTQALQWTGVVDLGKSMYVAPRLNWAGSVLGGLMFGIGMVFAGGCVSRNLVRCGAGDLRALLALIVVGIFAYMTIGGVIGPLRVALDNATHMPLTGLALGTQSLGEIAGKFSAFNADVASGGAALTIGGLLLFLSLSDAGFRRSPSHLISGLGVGLLVAAGWALTGLAYDELDVKPIVPISLTFVRPVGDTLDWLQRFTAHGLPAFGTSTVLGTILGGFAVALLTGRFRLSSFSGTADTVRNLGGAALMGIGGVMALGCSIGQGVTGVSTLAVASFLSTGAIIAGGIVGLLLLARLLDAETA